MLPPSTITSASPPPLPPWLAYLPLPPEAQLQAFLDANKRICKQATDCYTRASEVRLEALAAADRANAYHVNVHSRMEARKRRLAELSAKTAFLSSKAARGGGG